MTDARPLGADEATFIAAVRSDDTARFALITERHRRELQVHCYRMLANYEDAQDMTQETFLRAWNKRESFKGHAALRTWLYRIATNACLALPSSSVSTGRPTASPRVVALLWSRRRAAMSISRTCIERSCASLG